jgi:mitochondrial enoyl-[acyl-carrier protein] reductase / trans-2-enoyl-CoA reductase
MKQIEFTAVGRPEDVVYCADAEPPGGPGPNEVVVRVLAFPINPADLLTMQGVYPRLDAGSRTIGNEAVGEIVTAGEDVGGLAPGDRVILLSLNNWRQYRRLKATEVLKVSPRGDVRQQAGLKVNPATASLLLHEFVRLRPGDWLIQNAANSAVSRAIIQLACLAGVRTANLIRRAEVADELRALGADVVLLDGDDLPSRLQAEIGAVPLSLGIDSIGGAATDRIAACLSGGATLVVYGAMSGSQCSINPGTIVFKDLRIRGLWLSQYLTAASRDAIEGLYRRLDTLVASGNLVTRIDSVFRADDIKSAVRRASQASIDGKVIVEFERSGAHAS